VARSGILERTVAKAKVPPNGDINDKYAGVEIRSWVGSLTHA
jgi:hypothetical protein